VIQRLDLRQGETIHIQVHPDDDVTVAGVQVRAGQITRLIPRFMPGKQFKCVVRLAEF
jgi:hypothetical protein